MPNKINLDVTAYGKRKAYYEMSKSRAKNYGGWSTYSEWVKSIQIAYEKQQKTFNSGTMCSVCGMSSVHRLILDDTNPFSTDGPYTLPKEGFVCRNCLTVFKSGKIVVYKGNILLPIREG